MSRLFTINNIVFYTHSPPSYLADLAVEYSDLAVEYSDLAVEYSDLVGEYSDLVGELSALAMG